MPRTAIVTGAASGIGRALAVQLGREGWRVVVADRDGDAATAVAAGLPDGEPARVAVTDAAAVRELVHGVHARHGLALLANNAGIPPSAPADTPHLDLEDWRRVLEVNLMGVVHGVAAAYPLLVAQGRGAILNTASLAGLTFGPGLGAYGASKHAVVGYSLSLRAEAARYGVRVVTLCPSFVDTPLLDATMRDSAGATLRIRDQVASFGTGPLLSAEEVAEAALDGVRRDRALVVLPRRGRVMWRVTRFLPSVADLAGRKIAAQAPGYPRETLPPGL